MVMVIHCNCNMWQCKEKKTATVSGFSLALPLSLTVFSCVSSIQLLKNVYNMM